jgi:hypothetical protein
MGVMTFGGFGGEAFGDPFGGGGTLRLDRAIAVGGQVVRLVFSQAPKARSSAALNDALNSANYALTVLAGTATTPLPVGILQLVQYPAFGLQVAGEVGVDLQVDRPFVVGLQYQVTVSTQLVAADGSPIGAPYSASFLGAARPVMTRRNNRTKTDIIDWNSGVNGLIVMGGDIGTVMGDASTRIRCLRRTLTVKNAFAHLPGYGIGFAPKTPLSTARTGALKVDLAQQLISEPDVAAVTTNIQQDARGFVAIAENIQTKTGATLTLQVASS